MNVYFFNIAASNMSMISQPYDKCKRTGYTFGRKPEKHKKSYYIPIIAHQQSCTILNKIPNNSAASTWYLDVIAILLLGHIHRFVRIWMSIFLKIAASHMSMISQPYDKCKTCNTIIFEHASACVQIQNMTSFDVRHLQGHIIRQFIKISCQGP